jgi:hypothetical protein
VGVTACYDDFKGPAGYANYYLDNQSGNEIFLKYKLSDPEEEDVKLTSIIYPDSMVHFHSDKLTGENPTPETTFEWLEIYQRLNDTTDILRFEYNPMVDTVWTKEDVNDFDIGEKNWFLTYD